jgi:hypothetical protein
MKAKNNYLKALISYLHKKWVIIKENSDFKKLMNYLNKAWSIIKEDTFEIYEKYLKPKRKLPQERKRLNVWVFVLMIAISCLAFYIYLPLIAGMFSIIYQTASPEATPSPSNEAIISFIILSTALGTLILWFSRTAQSKDAGKQTNNGTIKSTGKLFLFTALVLSIFLLVNPLLPGIKESTGFYESLIKVVAFGSFIAGCCTFITAVLLGLFYIWKL